VIADIARDRKIDESYFGPAGLRLETKMYLVLLQSDSQMI